MNGMVQERVERAYRRIAEVDRPEAWITLRPVESVLAEAERTDAAVADGADLPLAGMVFAVKDNVDVRGMPTTAGCPDFGYLPERTATGVQRLLDAGALVLGKTNLDQFATGLVGTRSPYGVVRGSRNPELIAGGSSAGSAVVVALGIADFAIGTDTAGSGRVPAALNGIVGVKATIGVVPVDGVVPACASYDCLTAFAPTVALASRVTAVMSGPSALDPGSRTWPEDVRLAAPQAPRILVPRDADLRVLSGRARACFDAAVAKLRAAGASIDEIDLRPLLDVARILYDGAIVAERRAAFGAYLEKYPESADPTVAAIVADARGVEAVELVRDQQRVRAMRHSLGERFDGYDAMLLPTAPTHPTIASVLADPIGVNSFLGTYTNFVNLLDLAAVAVPAGEADGGLFGVSVIAPAFADQVAIDIAALLTDADPMDAPLPTGGVPLAVFGAHLRGEPLNHQLVDLGARFVGEVTTGPNYRMYALPGSPPKPGVVRSEDGVRLAGELWLLSPGALGRFLAALPAPMTLGKVELSDGRWVDGFGCAEPAGPDISEFGGWRAYLNRAVGR